MNYFISLIAARGAISKSGKLYTSITEDNRIDLSLRREGYDGVAASAESLYDLLKSQGGVLEVGDDSTPEAIHAETQMSKKVFKRAVGILLKRGDIVADKYQIRLK